MQFELWGRSRESKVYEFIESFQDEKQKYFVLDKVDQDVYYEAMIVKTDFNTLPVCIMYKEYDKEKQLILNRKGQCRDEYVSKY